MSPTASGPEQAALSRDLSKFLVELSIALHKHSMYPDGHPSLGPAAANVARRAQMLLETRPSLSLGVARHQLVIEGIATDPKHPVLRELASRLHRHQLGAVTLYPGLDGAELGVVMKRLAVDAERSGQPLGLGRRDELAWPHVRLHPVSFARLELMEEGETSKEGGGRGASLWVGLARAALAVESGANEPPPTTEPAEIAQAIESHPRSGAYDQVIVGYLLQIADELKVAGSAEALVLRRRVSHLLGAMQPETLRRLVDMGGDASQRQQFVLDASHGMAVDAVLEIVQAAAQASGQTVSHGLLRMLSKMARHATDGAETTRGQADAAVREQVRSLVQGWTLGDPNPEAYARALQAMSAAAPQQAAAERGVHVAEPLRMVELALELGETSIGVWRAVSSLIESGQVRSLAEVLDQLPAEHGTGREVWGKLASPGVVRRVLVEPVDFRTLDRLLPRLDLSAIEPLFDALATSQNRTTRRGLLDRLAEAPVDIAPLLLRGLADERWYVQRNMLVLLDALPRLPDGFSPAAYVAHSDARVRREALKLRLKLPAERDQAIVTGADDSDPQVAHLALIAAQQGCPPPAVSIIARRLAARGPGALPADLRPVAIRALGRATGGLALDALLRITDGGRTWFGRPKLPPKSPELIAALLALAAGWRTEGRSRAVLQLAGRSTDPEIRAAAGPRV